MRGVAKQRKMAVSLGQAWCDKGFHFTAVEAGEYITYGGLMDDPWPEPCRSCVELYGKEDQQFASDDEVLAIAREAAERWRGALEILRTS